jgi:hypothetical protein
MSWFRTIGPHVQYFGQWDLFVTGSCRQVFTKWAVSRQNQHNAFATSMDPDQGAHPRSLIRIHAVRLPNLLQVEKLIGNSVDPDQTAHYVGFVRTLVKCVLYFWRRIPFSVTIQGGRLSDHFFQFFICQDGYSLPFRYGLYHIVGIHCAWCILFMVTNRIRSIYYIALGFEIYSSTRTFEEAKQAWRLENLIRQLLQCAQ